MVYFYDIVGNNIARRHVDGCIGRFCIFVFWIVISLWFFVLLLVKLSVYIHTLTSMLIQEKAKALLLRI